MKRIQNGNKVSGRLLGWLALVLSLTLLATQAMSQIGDSSISGTVTDSAGAVIPGARVVVTNIRTGTSVHTVTNADGRYYAPQLGIGEYTVQAQKEGFQSVVHPDITLTVGANAVVDSALPVGQVTQQITVTGGAPLVNTTDSSVGTLINEQEIEDLPLNGRNLTQLTLLTPGVVPVDSLAGVDWGFGSPGRYATAGLRGEGQAILLDGTNIQGFWDQGPGLTVAGTSLGVDSIAEFRVFTDTYDAQYGGFGAATVEVSRSGANAFHGSGYLFTRNSVMDARNYFDPTTGPPPFHRYQFGTSIGGPIQKDKTFFFGNYEGLRQALGISSIFAVPDQNALNGYLPCSAAPDVACDTTTGLANVGVSSATAGIVNTYPSSNGPELGGGVAENLQPLSAPSYENYAMVRLDHNFSSSNSVFARYLIDYGVLTVPNPVPLETTTQAGHDQYFTMADREVISPTLLNSAMFGFTRTYNNNTGGTAPGLQVFPGRPSMWLSVGGLSGWAGDPFTQGESRYSFSDDVIWTHGKHEVRFGLAFTRTQADAFFPLFLGGLAAIDSLEDLLQNNVFVFEGPTVGQADPIRDLRDNRVGPYIQDNWQVTRRLALNLGFRYDYMTNPVETHNKLYALINPLSDSAYTHVPNVFQTNPAARNFAPRIGFAWDPFGTGKTSVRGGFGVFYDQYNEEVLLDSYSFDPPFYNMSTVVFTSFPNPFATSLLSVLPSPIETTSYKTNKTPYVMQFNLNIQQQLARNTELTVAYMGNEGRHEMIMYALNGCNTTAVEPNGTLFRDPTQPCIRQNPAFSYMQMHFSTGDSNYNSLQVSIVRRMLRGLQFTSNYTFSKNLDEMSGFTGVDESPGNPEFSMDNIGNANHKVDYGPSMFDNRHNWNTSVIYDLPFRGSRFISGWQASLIGGLISGHPFTVFDGFDQCNDGGGVGSQCRPDYAVPAVNPHVGKVNQWFNPNAYVLQQAGTVGNVGRNSLVGPGFADFDGSLSKNTRFESAVIDLRLDVFNTANRTNLAIPVDTLFVGPGVPDPLAGQIFGAGTSRQIQLSTRLSF